LPIVLNERDLRDHTREVDCGFYTRIATSYHCNTFALKQWAIAVRAIGYAFIAILLLAWHIEFAPARTGCQDHGFCFQAGATFQFDFNDIARDQRSGTL